ncbi:MAG: ABC transporter permease [Gammaproteobacteria bacterium]|nr:MAG: ABC transporter permease [Gammaproteobacteria bacterium]
MAQAQARASNPLRLRPRIRWRHGLVFGALLAFALIGASVLSVLGLLGDPMITDLSRRLARPGEAGFLLGSDQLGRDTLARVLAGLRWSLAVAAGATIIAAVVGVTLGLLAADRPGWIRLSINQLVDMVLSFPGLVIAIVVVAAIGHGFWALVLTLGLLSWPVFARVVYAEARSLLTRDYMLAARLAGSSRFRILAGHLLPGLAPSLSVMVAFHFADMMIAESALSFLGVGAPLGTPSLGNMLAESRQFLFIAPELMLVPATAIVLAVIAANLVGDGLASQESRLEEEK